MKIKHNTSTDSTTQRAVELRLGGMTYAEIARALKVSKQRIHQRIAPPQVIRIQILKRSNFLCTNCGIFIGTSGHVHHIKTKGLELEKYNDLENLVGLCISCHRKAHRIEPKSSRGRPKRIRARKRNQVTMRMRPEDRIEFCKLARKQRMSLSEWFRRLARQEIKRRANNKRAKAV